MPNLYNAQGLPRNKVIIVVAVLVVLALIGFFAYQMLRPGANSPAEPEKPRVSASGMVDIAELSISIKVPEALKDLTVSLKREVAGTAVGISVASLTERAPECAADKKAGLGTVSRLPGQYLGDSASQTAVGMLIKQFEDSYVYYLTPESSCTDDLAIQEELTKLSILFKNSLLSTRELAEN